MCDAGKTTAACAVLPSLWGEAVDHELPVGILSTGDADLVDLPEGMLPNGLFVLG